MDSAFVCVFVFVCVRVRVRVCVCVLVVLQCTAHTHACNKYKYVPAEVGMPLMVVDSLYMKGGGG